MNYDGYAEDRLSGRNGILPSINFIFPTLKNMKTLDIGCADGLYLQHLGGGSIGVEQHPDLVLAAKEKGCHVIAGSLDEVLPNIEEGSFEAVLFSHVMEHVDAPIVTLRQINVCLVHSGLLVLGLPTERNIFRDIFRKDYFDGTHIYAFTVRNTRKLLNCSGFEVQEIYYHLPIHKYPLGSLIEKVFNYLPIPFKSYLSMAYWITARKVCGLSDGA